ncbi:MAG: hypothetical protein EZS28_002427 [Streblomastix strix]|uniref:Uncharacterized protein n=1 Tax=Streblomastix strix TaxID=222440 RepID=A0A5J4X5I4_9EUKA|nr:MAG: hypothetical protein EZS28_002427 [Streblomastix strix]
MRNEFKYDCYELNVRDVHYGRDEYQDGNGGFYFYALWSQKYVEGIGSFGDDDNYDQDYFQFSDQDQDYE